MKKYRVNIDAQDGTKLSCDTQPIKSISDAIALALQKLALVTSARAVTVRAHELA